MRREASLRSAERCQLPARKALTISHTKWILFTSRSSVQRLREEALSSPAKGWGGPADRRTPPSLGGVEAALRRHPEEWPELFDNRYTRQGERKRGRSLWSYLGSARTV